MKLLTEMIETDTGRWFPAIRSNETCPMVMTHDAAAAHALMQALNEWGEKEYWSIDKLAARWVKCRADELMRTWGFGPRMAMSGEYRYQLGRWFSGAYCHFATTRQDIIDGACMAYRRPWWWLRLLGWKVIDREAGK